MIGLVLFWVSAPLWGTGADLAPHLHPATWKTLQSQLVEALPTWGLAAKERAYQNAAQKQSLGDVLQVYDRANRNKVKVAYTSFTAEEEGGRAGRDLGYGLRVVKRLDLGAKTIELKEFWPMDRKTGGLFRPEEIRIKTRVQDGPRGDAGSEQQYLFDRIYLAWGPSPKEVTVHRRTLYDENDGVRELRSPVSAPYSCMNCHQASSGLRHAYAKRGESLNPESIVQPSYFDRDKSEMRGLLKYTAYLKKKFPAKGAAVETALVRGGDWLWPEGMAAQLREVVGMGSATWLPDDQTLPPVVAHPDLLVRQGYYLGKYQETIRRDALESVFEGKYRWWDPKVVVP